MRAQLTFTLYKRASHDIYIYTHSPGGPHEPAISSLSSSGFLYYLSNACLFYKSIRFHIYPRWCISPGARSIIVIDFHRPPYDPARARISTACASISEGFPYWLATLIYARERATALYGYVVVCRYSGCVLRVMRESACVEWVIGRTFLWKIRGRR